VIQKAMGYDWEASNPLPPERYPFSKSTDVIEEDELIVPQQLIEHCATHNIQQVSQLQLDKHVIMKKGCFVSVSHFFLSSFFFFLCL
jgi:hypothetical protein